jgi:hypothetical protein
MLPSPSLGPPLLSASMSPAPGPCGIPDELELDELEPDDFEVVVAGAGVLLAGAELVDAGAGELLVDEEDELLPQPAAMAAAAASARNGSPRPSWNLLIMTNLCCLFMLLGSSVYSERHDAGHERTFPLTRCVPGPASIASRAL